MILLCSKLLAEAKAENYRRSQSASPKYAPLAQGLFWAESSSLPSPSCLKAGVFVPYKEENYSTSTLIPWEGSYLHNKPFEKPYLSDIS